MFRKIGVLLSRIMLPDSAAWLRFIAAVIVLAGALETTIM